MQNWLSFHFYPLETPDVFLARAVRPFVDASVWPVRSARAFFIRYDDEKGPHIRLRIRGEAEWLEETLRPALQGWFAGRGEFGEETYEPEPERFVGPEALALAEEYFHVSTRVVLDRLNREYTYADAMFDALRMHTISAFAAGFTREKASWYFARLVDLWIPLFFQPIDGQPSPATLREEILEQFEKSFQPQQEDMRMILGELWTSLEKEKFDTKQPEWPRWIRGNQLILTEFGDNLDKALPSLLHLNNNRLGINNQNEVYLAFILSKAL